MPSYAYEVQTESGQPLSGVLAAASQDAAKKTLEQLHFRVISLAPDRNGGSRRARPISGTDFRTFNQQLAHLTAAGLPVESGLKLIAEDMRSGRLSSAVHDIAADLDRGIPLAEAFERRAGQFPPLYARLVAAGVQTNDLPGMLLNLGRHLELLANLRNAVWRALAYPLVVFTGFLGVLTFLSFKIIPEYRLILADLRITVPDVTEFVLWMNPAIPYVTLSLFVMLVVVPLVWHGLSRLGLVGSAEGLLRFLPVIGKIVRNNLMARWCDALCLSVEAGVALPDSLALASDAVGSRVLADDSAKIIEQVTAGRRLDDAQGLRVVPRTVVTAMTLGAEQNDLPQVLRNLVDMYRYQAQEQVTLLPGILLPIFMIFAGGGIMLVIFALFWPLARIFTSFESWI